jgi:hypothetical protein
MTVLLATGRLPASALLEAREACKSLGLATTDWVGGMSGVTVPSVAPVAVIGGLDHGARRIPEELIALLDAFAGLQLVLCAQEPLVKPRVILDNGRVCVLGPPISRAQIAAALRTAARPPPPPVDAPVSRRFEVLRRSHWIAWARGHTGPAISLHEERGATVVIGDASHDRTAIAEAMASDQSDADRESVLGTVAGAAGVAHLTPDASEWVMYWPVDHCALWLCSPHRFPARWDAARGIAAVAHRRLLRVPAFPGDQLVAAWSTAPLPPDALAPVEHVTADGGCETIVGLDDVAAHHAHVTGLVMEVR